MVRLRKHPEADQAEEQIQIPLSVVTRQETGLVISLADDERRLRRELTRRMDAICDPRECLPLGEIEYAEWTRSRQRILRQRWGKDPRVDVTT
jgi:hypothetical protein